MDDNWKGAVPEVDEWWTGDTSSPTVLLQNDQEEIERNSIYNGKALFGVLPFCLSAIYVANNIAETKSNCHPFVFPNTSYSLSPYLLIRVLTPKCGSPGQNIRG